MDSGFAYALVDDLFLIIATRSFEARMLLTGMETSYPARIRDAKWRSSFAHTPASG